MSTSTIPEIAPDIVTCIRVKRGGLDTYLEMLEDPVRAPMIKFHAGRLLLVSPMYTHELASRRLDMFLTAVCGILRIPLRGCGSTLFRRMDQDHGIEPDSSYYIQSFDAVREVAEIDPRRPRCPAPDLMVEVVVTHGTEMATAVCLELRISELWLYHPRASRLVFLVLETRKNRPAAYRPSKTSRAFPFLEAQEIVSWITHGEVDDSAFDRKLRKWIRSELRPRYK